MSEVIEPRWLLLIHQIPPKPGYLRVKIWRRLQRLGAVAIKNSVYVLPRTESTHEDFQWILREIDAGGGDASICEARFVEGLEDEQILRLFHAARDADYAQLAEEARLLIEDLPARIPADQRAQVEAELTRLRRRFSDVSAIDFFGAAGQQVADSLLASIEARLQTDPRRLEGKTADGGVEAVRGRTWVTRTGVHIDRIASAWLIRRCIDPDARFKFVSGKGYRPEPEELRFDMFEAEYTHEGDRCTFEVLCQRFGLENPGLRPIAEIVHDIDLKDAKYGRPETAGVDHLVAGVAMTHKSDEERLDQGYTVFEALYGYFRKKRE